MPFIKNVAIFAKKTTATPSGESDFSPNIDAGLYTSGIIKTNGRLFMWGLNIFGELGNNSTLSKRTPVSVSGATKTFCKISAGGYSSSAIDKNGKAWCWGWNNAGQLGDNSTTNRSTPVSVAGNAKTFCQITVGIANSSNSTLVIDKNGRVWGWGRNNGGQLGDNSITNRSTPVSVAGAAKTFCKIAAGSSHTLAIDKNGRAWAWGTNGGNQLGDGTDVAKCTPISVVGATKTFCQIDGGQEHSLAIDKNGRAWAWGRNGSGQIGDNSSGINRSTPVSVAGAAKTFCKIAAGGTHSIAIDKNGKVWCWGSNNAGQLGDNSTTNRSTPVSVAGNAKTFCDISCGEQHSLAVDYNGTSWAWGYNTYGQLGDNSLTNRCTPVAICTL